MKKKVVKVLAVLLVVASLVTVLVACAKKPTELQIYKTTELDTALYSTQREILTSVSDFNTASDSSIVTYKKDGKLRVFNLKLERDVLEVDGTAVLTVAGSANAIYVWIPKAGDVKAKFGVYGKDGTAFLALADTEKTSSNDSEVKFEQVYANGSDIFVLGGKLYNGGKVILTGGTFSVATVAVYKEMNILVYSPAGTRKDIYDLDGNLIYSAAIPSDTYFTVLSKNKGLLATKYAVSDYDTNYTVYNNTAAAIYSTNLNLLAAKKYRLVYETVNFADGAKTEVKLNYILSVSGNSSLSQFGASSTLTDEAKGYALISATEIVGGVPAKNTCNLYVDENLAVRKVVTDSVSNISADRVLVKVQTSNTALLEDNAGKVIKAFVGSADFDASSGLIYESTSKNYYSITDGSVVIKGEDFGVINAFYAGYALATNKDGKTGIIDKAGTFTLLGENESMTSLSAGLFKKTNSTVADKTSVVNAKGDVIVTIDRALGNVVYLSSTTDEKGSVNKAFVTITNTDGTKTVKVFVK